MRLYLDANVWIKAVEGSGDAPDFFWQLLEWAGSGQRVVTSELSLAEVLVGPIKKRGEAISGPLASAYAELLTSGPALLVAPVERHALVMAAHVRARNSTIKLPDAIHLATAQRTQCTHFISGDERLLRWAEPEFIAMDLEQAGHRSSLAALL